MAGFSERLKRLSQSGGQPSSIQPPNREPPREEATLSFGSLGSLSDKATRLEQLRHSLSGVIARDRARLRERHASPANESIDLPGQAFQHSAGEVRVIDRYLEPDHHHGAAPVRDALSVCAEVVSKLALDLSMSHVDFRKALLIDTETTGLSGGAGTIPFLVGMAWFEDECLRVQQLFLPRFGEEAPLLSVLGDRLREASCLISYNGKSFDWPLLRARFVMNRLPMPEAPPHLDLLHCARRVYKRRFARMRLIDMERKVLGLYREDDVDGSEIPGIYFDFVRSGRADRLGHVIEHNQLDLVALAALLAKLAGHFETVRHADDPRDHLCYAELALRAGDVERAEQFALTAADGGGDPECTVAALLLAAKLTRRRNEVHHERAHLERALEHANEEQGPRVHLALAKLLEHRLRDPEAALRHARLARRVEDPKVHARRLARLERSLEHNSGSILSNQSTRQAANQ